MKLLVIKLCAVIAFALSGCATKPPARVNIASEQADAEAKSVMRLNDKAIVYFIRQADSFGNRDASILRIDINASHLGDLSADTYLKLTLNPGSYNFTGKWSFHLVRDNEWANYLGEGKTYFVKVGSKFLPLPWPGYATVFFEQVDDDEGRRLLSHSVLAKTALQNMAAEDAMQARYAEDSLANLKSYDIFSAVSFSNTVDVRYYRYKFGELFSQARPQLRQKLEMASLRQLMHFDSMYGAELMAEDKAMLKNIIQEREKAQLRGDDPVISVELKTKPALRTLGAKSGLSKVESTPSPPKSDRHKSEPPKPAPNPF